MTEIHKPVFTDARIAWHDSMHERGISITAASMSQAESSAKRDTRLQSQHEAVFLALGEDKEERVKALRQRMDARQSRTDTFDSTARSAKVAAMAKIQRAVHTLPPLLRRFGNLLYSPSPTATDLECSRFLLARYSRFPVMTEERAAKASSLIIPALLSYRDTAFGGREHWAPSRIIEFCQQYGVTFSPANWARDWSSIWERLLDSCAGFDQQALDPIWEIINKERGKAANDG
ncbi:hypothetical protein JFT60_10500 [Pseudomonas sp. MF6772]|uniref:hypothetical protein n=1 Tax=Pseudomonas sp. MF6772 TaxID=2797533 RepID=UPI0018E8831D|nr:hypothetical protein [Pseudomonas sp. MF6772]MBJ2267798.1 hypothetical protein [Pseudomonas sp. MF6772]